MILSVGESWLLQILHQSCNSWHSVVQLMLYKWSTSQVTDVHWFQKPVRQEDPNNIKLLNFIQFFNHFINFRKALHLTIILKLLRKRHKYWEEL